jgi:hypothetical protein
MSVETNLREMERSREAVPRRRHAERSGKGLVFRPSAGSRSRMRAYVSRELEYGGSAGWLKCPPLAHQNPAGGQFFNLACPMHEGAHAMNRIALVDDPDASEGCSKANVAGISAPTVRAWKLVNGPLAAGLGSHTSAGFSTTRESDRRVTTR